MSISDVVLWRDLTRVINVVEYWNNGIRTKPGWQVISLLANKKVQHINLILKSSFIGLSILKYTLIILKGYYKSIK